MWIFKRVTLGSPTVVLASPPPGFIEVRKFLHVVTAFNAGTDNNLSFGYTGSQQAFGTNTSVATTGRKSVTDGTASGYNATARVITAYYTQSGSAASTGEAIVGVELVRAS